MDKAAAAIAEVALFPSRYLVDGGGFNETIDGRTDDMVDAASGDDLRNEILAPSTAPSAAAVEEPPTALNEQEKIGFAVLVIATLISCIGIWRCYICWKRSRERRMMELVNAHADNMLGDMVMVPTGDSFNEFDNDDGEGGELI